jgi:hypothetical protein
MKKILAWFDSIPLVILIFAALFLGMAPFVPEPHLFEKIRMITAGTLDKPIDIFDLCYHGLPIVLLAIRLLRMYSERSNITAQTANE